MKKILRGWYRFVRLKMLRAMRREDRRSLDDWLNERTW